MDSQLDLTKDDGRRGLQRSHPLGLGRINCTSKKYKQHQTTVDDCSILCLLMSFVGWTEMLRLPALLNRSSKMTKAEAQHGTRMYKALPSAG